MAAPAGWGITVSGLYLTAAGERRRGRKSAEDHLLFVPRFRAATDSEHAAIIMGTGVQAPIAADGTFSVTLPHTDDPDLDPTDFTYMVREMWDGGRIFDIALPQSLGSAVDLRTVLPAEIVEGVSLSKGDTGATPNLTMGAIDTVPYGTPPDATITGTTDDPILNLTVTAGAPGGSDAATAGWIEGGPLTSAALSATYALVAGIGSADDTAHLNSLLSAGGTVRGKAGETYTITGPLLIGSDATLDMTGCRIVWKDGAPGDNLIRNTAAAPVRQITDAAITAASTTLTSATAAFTSADLGRTACVAGARGDEPGKAVMLTANITAVTNGTTVELSRAAQITVTGATAKIHDRQANIKIIGGVWDKGGATTGGASNGLHGLLFRHVDGLTVHIEGYEATQAGAKYAMSIASVTRASLSVTNLDTISDGIHLIGPCDRVEIPYVGGKTGDDMVSLTGADYPAYSDCAGDITNVHVQTMHANGVARAFHILSGSGCFVDNVTAGNLSGTSEGSGVFIGESAAYWDTTGGQIGTVDLGTVALNCGGEVVKFINTSAQSVAARITGLSEAGQQVKYLSTPAGSTVSPPARTMGELRLYDCVTPSGQTLMSMDGDGCTIGKVTIDRATVTGTGRAFTGSRGTVKALTFNQASLAYASDGTPFFLSSAAASVDHLHLLDGEFDLSGSTNVKAALVGRSTGDWKAISMTRGRLIGATTKGCMTYSPSSVPCVVTLDHAVIEKCARIVDTTPGGIALRLSEPVVETSQEIIHSTTGGTVTGSIAVATGVGAGKVFSPGSTGTKRVNGRNLGCDLALLTPVVGDQARNTSASSGAGWYVGEVVYDGTKWVPLRGYAYAANATLVAGTLAITTTEAARVTATSRIRVFRVTDGTSGAPGALFVTSVSPGVGFTISSTSPTDVSVVRWEIVAY